MIISDIGTKIYYSTIINCVKKNKFNIIPRDKNLEFMYMFKLDKKRVREMLLLLGE